MYSRSRRTPCESWVLKEASGSSPRAVRRDLPKTARTILTMPGSFDFVAAPLRETATRLRMIVEKCLRLLGCEREQHEDVNPQRGHEVPIPGGDVDHDAAGFDGAMQYCSYVGYADGDDAAGEMKSMHRRQDVDERTAGPSEQVKSAGRELLPREELAGEESKAENGCDAEPWEYGFVSQRNGWDGFHRSQSGFAGDSAARQFDRERAQDQDQRVRDQDQPWQVDGNPGANIGIAGHIETDIATADHVYHGERNEQHGDRRHENGESPAGAA